MTNPLDNSDLASLIQADWHEEFGDIDYANEIREGVLEPQINTWDWSDRVIGVGVVGGIDIGVGGADPCVGDVSGSKTVGAYANFGSIVIGDIIGGSFK